MDIVENEESRLILLVVIIPFVIFLVVFPPLLIKLDQQDYKKLEADEFNISDLFLEKLCKRTKHKHIEEVYYKISEI